MLNHATNRPARLLARKAVTAFAALSVVRCGFVERLESRQLLSGNPARWSRPA